jgi:hypothetical protein
MPGIKLFINSTGVDLDVTLKVRSGSDPNNNAPDEYFFLAQNTQKEVSYGNQANIYLNGIDLIASGGGDIRQRTDIVITRGSYLDDLLNRHNTVNFQGIGFSFTTWNRNR